MEGPHLRDNVLQPVRALCLWEYTEDWYDQKARVEVERSASSHSQLWPVLPTRTTLELVLALNSAACRVKVSLWGAIT